MMLFPAGAGPRPDFSSSPCVWADPVTSTCTRPRPANATVWRRTAHGGQDRLRRCDMSSCARSLACLVSHGLSLPRSTPLIRDKRKPQTSHGGRVRCKPESGIQVRKGCLMSLTVMHETVLHVAQMRPETWEAVGILSGSGPPSHGGTGNL